MGTTMSFYLVENRNATVEQLKKGMAWLCKGAGERRQGQEELFSALIKSFMDMDRFDEVKDEMRRENPELFAFISQVKGDGEKAHGGEVIPFSGVNRPGREGSGPVLAYRPDAKWLPLFEETLCEGYNASTRDTDRMAEAFGAPVLAFSVFDSDYLFVSYSDPAKGVHENYAKSNFEEDEEEEAWAEYDTDLYEKGFPTFLCDYAGEAALRAVWEGEEVFADDRMVKLCELIGAQVLYDAEKLPRGFRRLE